MKDWAQEAANEIAEDVRHGDGNEEDYRSIIVKHCPFKPDTAYMPVPRCESCGHWEQENVTPENTAECTLKIMSATVHVGSTGEEIHFQMRTKADFGCVQWEAK